MKRVLCAALAMALGCDGDGPRAASAPRLTAWTIGPDQPSYTRKTNLLEGARRVNAERAAAGLPALDIDVDFATTGHAAYAKKLVFAFAAGRAPDIICGGHELIGQLGGAGQLHPLDDLVAAAPDFAADVFPVLWDAMKHGGRIYGVPQDHEVRLVYYRTDVLRRLGLDEARIARIPADVAAGAIALEDLIDLGERALAAGAIAPGRGFFHRNRAGFDWLAYLLAFGARLEDERGRLVLSRAASGRLLALLHRLVRARLTPAGMTSYPDRTIYAAFARGEAFAYITGGSWHKLEWQAGFALDEARFRRDVGFAPIPGARRSDGGPARPVTISHPFACMIGARAADPALAFRVIARSLDPDLDVAHALGSSHLAVRRSSAALPAYRADPFLAEVTGYLRFTRFAPNHVKLDRFSRVVFDAIRGVEVGMLTPAEGLAFIEDVGRARLGDDLAIED